jgi:bifunctional UDP-N-acetylglucosamine pyrophosphorylase/glucosamine-1-phosphate N-acetyltransferase
MYMNGSKQKMGRRRLAIVLAAGEGTRMKSAIAKVLHPIAHRSMLGHVLTHVAAMGADAVAVVVGPEHANIAAEAFRFIANPQVFVQAERLGTAHAVLAARPALEQGFDDVLIVFADSPLVQAATLRNLCDAVDAEVAVAVLGFHARNPHGYGRLIMDNGAVIGIREHGDASPDERALTLCNAGLMALAGRHAVAIVSAINNHNSKGEYYLTDAVAIALAHHWRTALVMADEDEVLGVNDRIQLAEAEAVFQNRMRRAVMHAGATLIAPETVFFAYDTQLGRDVCIGPHVVFGPGVVVEDGATIEAFSHIEGATIGRRSIIGPFARLRPGTRLAENVKIGNFVETKAALVGQGSKLNHLSYVGDAQVGAQVNIGAGTITCNYDGEHKHQTIIGAGAFVGSNSALVAPVTVGAGAYIGSGSVITHNVPDDALALARGRQINIGNWALRRRQAAEPNKKPNKK